MDKIFNQLREITQLLFDSSIEGVVDEAIYYHKVQRYFGGEKGGNKNDLNTEVGYTYTYTASRFNVTKM